MSNNPYKILGIDENAEFIVIKAAYRAMANKYHPDKWQGDKKEAEDKIKEINNAYDILSDDNKKKEYDNKNKSKPENKSEQKSEQKKNKTDKNKPNSFFYPKPSNPENIFPSLISNFCSSLTDKLIWIYLVFNYLWSFSLFSKFSFSEHFQYDYTKVNSPPHTLGTEILFVRVPQFLELCLPFILILFLTTTTHNYKNLLKDSFKINFFNRFLLKVSQNTNFIEIFYYALFILYVLAFMFLFFDLLIVQKIFNAPILYTIPFILVFFFAFYLLGMAINYSKFNYIRRISLKEKILLIFLLICPLGLFYGTPSFNSLANQGILIEYRLELINFIILIFIFKYVYEFSQKHKSNSPYKKLILYVCVFYSLMMWISGVFLEFRLYKLLSILF